MTDKSKVKTEIATPATPVSPRRPSPKEKSWEENTLKPTLEKSPERRAEFTTISGHPIRHLYTEADLPDWSPEKDLGLPGEPPYPRGIHSTMHRARLWTMRQFAGFGAAEDTNARLHDSVMQRSNELSTALRMPTLLSI